VERINLEWKRRQTKRYLILELFIIDGIQTYSGYMACVGNARYEVSGISLL
jgi:MFS-type transporter involved in bile tolerance (Atg22 family)